MSEKALNGSGRVSPQEITDAIASAQSLETGGHIRFNASNSFEDYWSAHKLFLSELKRQPKGTLDCSGRDYNPEEPERDCYLSNAHGVALSLLNAGHKKWRPDADNATQRQANELKQHAAVFYRLVIEEAEKCRGMICKSEQLRAIAKSHLGLTQVYADADQEERSRNIQNALLHLQLAEDLCLTQNPIDTKLQMEILAIKADTHLQQMRFLEKSSQDSAISPFSSSKDESRGNEIDEYRRRAIQCFIDAFILEINTDDITPLYPALTIHELKAHIANQKLRCFVQIITLIKCKSDIPREVLIRKLSLDAAFIGIELTRISADFAADIRDRASKNSRRGVPTDTIRVANS